ncbi:hypothetical protein [Hyphococcus sp.]|uniref:hypothetical protein n=1 Tax=Hyphococcus sp. TaxID=2038636 RepID=UPI003CCB7572
MTNASPLHALEQSKKFEGQFVGVAGPFSNWPPKLPSIILNKQTAAGTIQVTAMPASTLIVATRQHSTILKHVETCPLKGPDKSPFVLSIRWQGSEIGVWVNGSCAASTDTQQETETSIEWHAPVDANPILSLHKDNESSREARKKDLLTLKIRANRLPASTDHMINKLQSARLQLADQIASVQRGQIHHDTALAARLRALICHMNNGYPLLQRLAGAFDLPLIVYAVPPSPEPKDLITAAQLIIDQHVAPSATYSVDAAMDLDFWLNAEKAHCNGSAYSNNAIIRAYADTEAAHYDEGIEPLVASLKEMSVVNPHGSPMMALHTFLLNVAKSVMPLCDQVLAAARTR